MEEGAHGRARGREAGVEGVNEEQEQEQVGGLGKARSTDQERAFILAEVNLTSHPDGTSFGPSET
ncbi:hypothetical protein CVT25_013025 [Psilocybe cyanescens]|uniref:Uncharacterized protein n=1 Tax=Psilocybe cyanescens TaxID=93625 RepID=A0A409XLT9_PSICY|nr:hypothetical protein CVT25_013025 [Psilocybe cyanescens]